MRSVRRAAVHLAAALISACGIASLARWLRRRRGDFRVFILTYHDVNDGGREPEGVVSAARLRRHLQAVRRDYRIVSLSEAMSALRRPEGLREDLAVITFDDGYAGTYECGWPVLRAEGIPATVFVTTGFLDGDGLWFDRALRCLVAAQRQATPLPPSLQDDLHRMLGRWPLPDSPLDAVERLKGVVPAVRDRLLESLEQGCAPLAPPARPLRWEQVRELAAAGIEIGVHTVSHPILSSLSVREQEREILEARDRIAACVGVRPTLFAYPNGTAGDFDENTVAAVQRAGLEAACTTSRGANSPGCDPYRLRRIGVGAEPCFVLGARLTGLFDQPMVARSSAPAAASRFSEFVENPRSLPD